MLDGARDLSTSEDPAFIIPYRQCETGRLISECGATQAEHFDSKIRTLGSPLFTVALQNKIFDLQELTFVFLTVDMAIMDANSEVWGQVRNSVLLQGAASARTSVCADVLPLQVHHIACC